MENENKKTPLAKRVIAWVCIVLLLLVYVVFFFVALFGKTGPGSAFLACAAATVAIPILVWLILWVYTALSGKRTVASPDPYGKFDGASDKENTDQ
ncbi:hypothetical protein [Butyrivibrio sp. WCD3002]|uniref:hypothetical protein n=1 Tax=Butyrivibrio sp. WCD3002 TaxID=1280676 RepID=UPI00041B6DB9|nr:hypothetical protein [Butyrivibrio sp. WCD3002]